MQTAADLSAPEVGAAAPLVDASPFLDHSIEPEDDENSYLDGNGNLIPYVVHHPEASFNAPLISLSARALGNLGRDNPNHMGFFREAGKVVRTIVGPDGKFGSAPALDLAAQIADDPQCNPVALATQLDTATSKEWRGWLPETLTGFLAVPEDDVASRDKLLATQVAVTNDDVFSNWSLFTAVNSAFNHRRSNFQFLDKPSYLEAANTCFTLRQLRPGLEFKDGVVRFLVAMLIEDGLCFFPWTGGHGLALGVNEDISVGLTDVKTITLKIKQLWDSGVLHGVTPGDHDDRDPLHVQLAKIAECEAYIKAQHSVRPSDYQLLENENATKKP